MTIQATGRRRSRRLGDAIWSAAGGLLAGVAIHAITGTVEVLLNLRVEVGEGAGDWLAGSVLVFASALFWGAMVGAIVVWPLASVVIAILAGRNDAAATIRERRTVLVVGLWALVFGALWAVGAVRDIGNAIGSTIAIVVGAAIALRLLDRRLGAPPPTGHRRPLLRIVFVATGVVSALCLLIVAADLGMLIVLIAEKNNNAWYFPYSLFVLPVLLISAPTCWLTRRALRTSESGED